MELLTKVEGSERQVTVSVDLGETRDGDELEALKAALIERGVKPETVNAVVTSHARANLKVYFRAGVKTGMKPNKDGVSLTDEEIQAKVDKMIPGVAAEREGANAEKKLAAAQKAYDGMTAEDQAAFLEKLQNRLKSKVA